MESASHEIVAATEYFDFILNYKADLIKDVDISIGSSATNYFRVIQRRVCFAGNKSGESRPCVEYIGQQNDRTVRSP